MQLLIKNGVDVNAQDGSHSTPLHLVLSSWSPKAIHLLIKHGVDINACNGSNRMPLHLASCQVSAKLTLGLAWADANGQDKALAMQFHWAELNKKAKIVQLLSQHGADMTARDKTHLTPLHLALFKWSGDTVKLLIWHGADVNAQNVRHSMPLHLALSSHWDMESDVMHLLLSHGANIGVKDDEGWTLFQIVSSRGPSKIAEFLSDVTVGKQLTRGLKVS